MRKALLITGVVAITATLCFLSYKAGQERGKTAVLGNDEIKYDTIYHTDTITAYKPVFIECRSIDTMYIQVRDTIRQGDTLYLPLQREQVIWQDSLARVYASGVSPHIDSVLHFVPTRTITATHIRSSRWGIGIQAGLGASRNGITPYVGVGITYSVYSF